MHGGQVVTAVLIACALATSIVLNSVNYADNTRVTLTTTAWSTIDERCLDTRENDQGRWCVTTLDNSTNTMGLLYRINGSVTADTQFEWGFHDASADVTTRSPSQSSTGSQPIITLRNFTVTGNGEYQPLLGAPSPSDYPCVTLAWFEGLDTLYHAQLASNVNATLWFAKVNSEATSAHIAVQFVSSVICGSPGLFFVNTAL